MDQKFTTGLSAHIGLEKGIPLEAVEKRMAGSNGGDNEKDVLRGFIINRIKFLLRDGLSNEKIKRANVRDVSICIAILLKKVKELAALGVKEENILDLIREESIGSAVDNISRGKGILSDTTGGKITDGVSLPQSCST